MVLGLVREGDPVLQRQIESNIAAGLRELGYSATTSVETFGPKAFGDLRDKEVETWLKATDIDAVIAVVLLYKPREPGYVAIGTPQPQLFWSYYGNMYNRIYSEGYWITDMRYCWETNLYALKTGELRYSVQTQSFDPASTNMLVPDYSTLIVKDMTRRQVIRLQPEIKGF